LESPDVYEGGIKGDFPEQSIYLISIPMKIGIHINLDSGLRRNNNIKVVSILRLCYNFNRHWGLV
jgi:hypothetical protein